MNSVAFILTIAVTGYLLICVGIFSRKKLNYSQMRHTISELGEAGGDHARSVAYLVFLPTGLLLFLIAYLAQPHGMPTVTLAGCIAVGYVIAAFSPCDVGSPLTGSGRQSIHNLGGTVEYLGGAVALLQLSKQIAPLFSVAGYFVLGAGVAISIPVLAGIRGLIQRVAEICLFAGLALALWFAK